MKEDLELIDSRLRVTTNFDMVLRAVDKEFSLCCNYSKGHGNEFNAWMKEYHPGALLFQVESGSGSRQDFTTDGAGAVYMNRNFYVEFLDKSLTAEKDNILQKNLFIILTSSQMIAVSRVYAIFHVAICFPMRYLAGKAHTLGAHDFSIRSMGKVIDTVDEKLKQIVDTPENFISYDFMKDIFKELIDKIPPFKEYLTYMFEIKQSRTINKATTELKYDLLVAELFFPTRQENKDTDNLVKEMGKVAAEC